jgi:hypothetical protein
MSLQHELGHSGLRIPELHTAIFAAREDPASIGGKCDTKNKVLLPLVIMIQVIRAAITYSVPIECTNATASLGALVGHAPRGRELPHLDRLVQATADKVTTIWRECHAVNTIFVAIRTLEALDKIPVLYVPDAYTLVQRSGSHELGVWGDCNCCHTVFDTEGKQVGRGLNVPEPDSPVTATRSNRTTVTCKVKGVDVLIMAGESVADGARGNVPDLVKLASLLPQHGRQHTLINLSSAPVARYLPSGLKHTLLMYKSPFISRFSSCRMQSFSPVATSKICALLLHPVATYFPSWLNLTQHTTLSC